MKNLYDETMESLERVCSERLKEAEEHEANFYFYQNKKTNKIEKLTSNARFTQTRASQRASSSSFYPSSAGSRNRVFQAGGNTNTIRIKRL